MEASESYDSWESASFEKLEKLPAKQRRKREEVVDIKVRILHRLLYIVELLRSPRFYPVSDEINEYEVFRELESQPLGLRKRLFPGFYRSAVDMDVNYFKDTTDSACSKAIDRFVALVHNRIECRLYFALCDDVVPFIEYAFRGKVVEHKNRYAGNILGVDKDGIISDQTLNFGRNPKYYRLFVEILSQVTGTLQNQPLDSISIEDTNVVAPSVEPVKHTPSNNVFTKLDHIRKSAIPDTLSKLKIHPYYTVEELCKANEIIYPKGKTYGVLKGRKIYDKKYVQKIKTVSAWYREGRILKGIKMDVESTLYSFSDSQSAKAHNITKPYRIVNGKYYYAHFQTQKISIPFMKNGSMDAFHSNFIPLDSVYIDYDPDICRLLNIKYSNCVVGFKRGEPVNNGFFIEKKHCNVVHEAIMEKQYYEKVVKFNHNYESVMAEWRVLLKKAELYLRIKEHIG